MLSTLNLSHVTSLQRRGLLKYGRPNPVLYLASLEAAGFVDARMVYHEADASRPAYQSIAAVKPLVLVETKKNVVNLSDSLDKSPPLRDAETLFPHVSVLCN